MGPLGWEPEDAPIETQIEAWLDEVRPEGRRGYAALWPYQREILERMFEADSVVQALRKVWGI
jgi:hypothetical protein